MHRLSFDKRTGALPGSQPPGLQTRENPGAITPLVEQLKLAHDRAIGVLKGEIASDRTPTLPLDQAGNVIVERAPPKIERPVIVEPPSVDIEALTTYIPPDLSPVKLSIGDE
jgi:hypothetical protein